MKFSVGDPVYIKSTGEEGKIVELTDAKFAKVRVNSTTCIIALEDMEHPYLRWFLNKNKQKSQGKIYVENIQKEKNTKRQTALLPGVYLVFFPQYIIDAFDEKIDKVKIFIYNETDFAYNFQYEAFHKEKSAFEINSQIQSNTEFYLHDISFEHIANSPVFQYRFTQTEDDSLQLESFLSLKPKKLFTYLDKIRHENHPFFSVQLFEKINPKPIEQVEILPINAFQGKEEKANHFDFSHAISKNRYEIDLHIEKLVENHHQLSSAEKLNIQLKEFEKALDLAAVTHQRSIIFIHGIGKGRLKSEIHQILLQKKQTKSIKTYVNNYDTRYGYGATEVFL